MTKYIMRCSVLVGILSVSACTVHVDVPPPPPVAVQSSPYPDLLTVSETGSVATFHGTWKWDGDHYAASWENGATAFIHVVQFNDEQAAFLRDHNENSQVPGGATNLRANYVGVVHGHHIDGTVTWIWLGPFGPTRQDSGTWSADW
jgi:hypothetical protein